MSQIQAVLFPRSKWREREAQSWLHEHGFNPIREDVTKATYRYRIRDPKRFAEMRTKRLTVHRPDREKATISFIIGTR